MSRVGQSFRQGMKRAFHRRWPQLVRHHPELSKAILTCMMIGQKDLYVDEFIRKDEFLKKHLKEDFHWHSSASLPLLQ